MESHLSQNLLSRNVRLFIWFRVLFNARFYYPVFAVFFTDMGLSVAQFLWLNAIWALTIVVCEVPSGVLADLLGRRKLVIFSALSMAVEMLLLIVAPEGAGWWLFGVCAVNRVLSGLAEAAASGADEALAYDSLKQLEGKGEKLEESWDDVLVATMRWRSLAMVIAMLIGGVVYDHTKMTYWLGDLPRWLTMKLPVILCFISACFCVVIAFRMSDLGVQKKKPGEGCCMADIGKGVREAVSWVLQTRWIAVVIVAGFLIDAVTRTFVTLQSSYFRHIELPDYSYGIIGGIMSLGGWVVPVYVKRLAARFSPRTNVMIAGGVGCVGLVGVAVAKDLWGVLPSFVVMLALTHIGFLLSRYINRGAPSDKRASILSVSSLTLNITYGLFSIFVGLRMGAVAVEQGDKVAFTQILNLMPAVLLGSLIIWYVSVRFSFGRINQTKIHNGH